MLSPKGDFDEPPFVVSLSNHSGPPTSSARTAGVEFVALLSQIRIRILGKAKLALALARLVDINCPTTRMGAEYLAFSGRYANHRLLRWMASSRSRLYPG